MLLVFSCSLLQSSDPDLPDRFLLSWQTDPSTSMTIDWHPQDDALSDQEQEPSRLLYRQGSSGRFSAKRAEVVPVPYSDRWFYRVELASLQPDTDYEFRFAGFERTLRFRTMPDGPGRPLRFVLGGDLMHRSEWMRNTALSVMEIAGEELDFVVVGGDLAYADGNPEKLDRWFTYLSVWASVMITPSGRVIPHVAAIGNHEVKRGFAHLYSAAERSQPDYATREAPFYSTFVPFPGKRGYGMLDIGRYLSLFILDSGHLYTVQGAQTEWLAAQLDARTDVTHRIPVYHVPAWPSNRGFNGTVERAVRTHWVPLFEQHGVKVAFEHHDHTYKRTHPLFEGAVDAERGIVYVGDGAWGVSTREPRRDEQGNLPWYLARAEPLRHFILVDLDGPDLQLRMYTEDGVLLDEYTP